MSKKGLPTNEFFLKCPLYTKGLKVCPSSKDRLQEEDVQNLMNHCITEKYKSCSFYINKKEHEQAA